MPAIYTRRNHVMVGKVLPEDRFVATYIMPKDSGRYLLTVQPIDRLASAVRWALDMADYMAGPIEVLTIASEDDLMKQLVTVTAFGGMHGCTDAAVQAQARDVLVNMGVLP
jgi:hypothetical protein